MNNERIKEAFDVFRKKNLESAEESFANQYDSYGIVAQLGALGFHGGYTAADREWREKVEKLMYAYKNCRVLNVTVECIVLDLIVLLGADSPNKE